MKTEPENFRQKEFRKADEKIYFLVMERGAEAWGKVGKQTRDRNTDKSL